MDDTQTKIDSQQPQPLSQQPTQKQPAVPAQPVGTLQKEHIVSPTSEFVKPSEEEPKIPPEVAKVGVEKVTGFPTPSEEQEQVGIKPSPSAAPVKTEPSGELKLPPIPEKEVLAEIRTTKNDDSKHWLMVLFEKIYQQIRAMHKKLINS